MNDIVPIDRVIYDIMPAFQRIASKRQKVRWAEESQYALQLCKSNPKLLECDQTTLQDAIINVASVGLSLNPANGHCYLVPEYNKASKMMACQLRVSFRGLIKLATDSGSIKWVKADVVKEKDTFEYHGFNKIPLHHMDPFADRGKTVGAYCVASLASGELLVDVIDRGGLERIKACAKTQVVWDQWFDENSKKAIIKRAAKQWPPGPQSDQLDEAIKVINEAEGNDFDEFEELGKVAAYISENIQKEDLIGVGEAWCESTDRQREQLWRAKTKGGYFTQQEKEIIRKASREYRLANMSEEEKQEYHTRQEEAKLKLEQAEKVAAEAVEKLNG